MRLDDNRHPRGRAFVAALALLVAVVSAAGCGSGATPGELLPGARWRWRLARGVGFAEVTFDLAEGARSSLTFRASGPVRWDVHRHEPGRTLVLQSGTAAERTVEVVAPASGLVSVGLAAADTNVQPITVEATAPPDAPVAGAVP